MEHCCCEGCQEKLQIWRRMSPSNAVHSLHSSGSLGPDLTPVRGHQRPQAQTSAASAVMRRLLGSFTQTSPAPSTAGLIDQIKQAGVTGTCSACCEAVQLYWKVHDHLTHVVVREAGHMVPQDAPMQAQYMIERWLEEALMHA